MSDFSAGFVAAATSPASFSDLSVCVDPDERFQDRVPTDASIAEIGVDSEATDLHGYFELPVIEADTATGG